jgi:cell division septal protein FtsQ
MKKIHKIILLLISFFFLSTYAPHNFKLISEEKNTFFKVKNIKIINNYLIKENIIKNKLNKIYNKNIFLIKRKDIESPLKEINFLESIEVKIKYPNTIVVKIFETKPVAILFKNKSKYLLDSSSNLIKFIHEKNFNRLPVIFGDKAEKNFINFYKKLKKHNFPINKIQNFYYFQIDRWDLELLNKKIIKFPYNNTDDAIKKSIELLNREDFKNYNIIDLRINGKVIVE